MTRRTRADRLEDLLAEIMAHPHRPRTLVEVAHAVGREVTAQFGKDLLDVRNMAADAGHCITRCEYRRGGAQVFRFLPEGDEHGMGRPGLDRQAADVRSRSHNLGRTAAYMVAHAVRPEDRAAAGIDARVSTVVAEIYALRDDVSAAMRTPTRVVTPR